VSALLDGRMEASQCDGGARRPRVFAPFLYPSTFVLQDIDTLAAAYDVCRLRVPPIGRGLPGLAEVFRADLLFCWFGSARYLPYVVLARLLGKPVLIIAGGYDVAAEPSIDYGNMRPGLSRLLGRLLFRLATVTVAFSESSRLELEQNAGVSRDRSRLIMLGFDIDRPPAPVDRSAKRPMVLAVGVIDDTTIHRKGLLTMARMSRLLPDVSVVFVGEAQPAALAELQAVAGPNVSFTGFASPEELAAIYREAAVYAQPSVHEGFGCTVAEAMLYDCVPVVSDRGSLPEVVGPCGYYTPPNDPAALAVAVRRALTDGAHGPESSRERIRRLFPVSLRRARLTALVGDLLAQRMRPT
jgi:glycosyltransferase involved in cell wall biosynthesis